MTDPISRSRFVGSLLEAASWPGADPNAVVALATALATARADEQGSSYFQALSERNPSDTTALALAGFFQLRAGLDGEGAVKKLDKAACMDMGLPQYFRGLALAELLSGGGRAPREAARAEQVVADLEFVLGARDAFPVGFLRAAYEGLARAYQVLGREEQATEAQELSGLRRISAEGRPIFTGFSVTARDGMRLSTPSALRPAPNVHVAQSYDFGDFSFIETSEGIVAIDSG